MLNFGIADKNNGNCNLRFDVLANKERGVRKAIEDVKWLGFSWGIGRFFASDYFDQMYDYAVQLIIKGRAFVCDQNSEEIKKSRDFP